MTSGEILLYSGAGLLVFTLILAAIFRVTRKEYHPPEDYSARPMPSHESSGPDTTADDHGEQSTYGVPPKEYSLMSGRGKTCPTNQRQSAGK